MLDTYLSQLSDLQLRLANQSARQYLLFFLFRFQLAKRTMYFHTIKNSISFTMTGFISIKYFNSIFKLFSRIFSRTFDKTLKETNWVFFSYTLVWIDVCYVTFVVVVGLNHPRLFPIVRFHLVAWFWYLTWDDDETAVFFCRLIEWKIC